MDKPVVPHQIRKVFEGRIFSVIVESITLPKGGALEAEIVRHPGSVVLVPVTNDGEIVLVRQYRPAIGRRAWELPAGTLKPNEEPKQAAARPLGHRASRRRWWRDRAPLWPRGLGRLHRAG